MERIVLVKSTIGKRLKEIRIEAGLSQKDIASRIEVRRETIGRWERGDYTPQRICESKIKEIITYLEDIIRSRDKKFKRNHDNTRLPKLS